MQELNAEIDRIQKHKLPMNIQPKPKRRGSSEATGPAHVHMCGRGCGHVAVVFACRLLRSQAVAHAPPFDLLGPQAAVGPTESGRRWRIACWLTHAADCKQEHRMWPTTDAEQKCNLNVG